MSPFPAFRVHIPAQKASRGEALICIAQAMKEHTVPILSRLHFSLSSILCFPVGCANSENPFVGESQNGETPRLPAAWAPEIKHGRPVTCFLHPRAFNRRRFFICRRFRRSRWSLTHCAGAGRGMGQRRLVSDRLESYLCLRDSIFVLE